jgi:hypothetical protein
MTALTWDQTGQRRYETGVDHGVLYKPNSSGNYDVGYAWNGLVSVTESPSGAESNPQYADNIKYLNLVSAEEFTATIEAFTYPPEFAEHDGSATPQPGINVGQQSRKPFGLSYRTRIGTDLDSDAGYKLHLIYGCQAAPSEKAYTTINDSPEAITFSWEVTTTPVNAGAGLKPASSLEIDSTQVDETALAALEDMLYGTAGTDPELPLPEDVIALFEGTITTAVPTEPSFDSGTDTITIPTVTGVVYKINGEVVAAGPVVITENTIVTAEPAPGYRFPAVTDDDWLYTV